MKRRLLTFILSLVLLVSFSSLASATYLSRSGSWSDIWVDSDGIPWPIQTNWMTQETYTLSSGYNVITYHNNEGFLKNAKNIGVDQTMDNSTSLQQKSSSTSTTYSEIGRINYYEWSYPSGGVIIGASDIYFPGVKSKTIKLKPSLGKAYYYWANYIDEGYMGSSGYIRHSYSVTF